MKILYAVRLFSGLQASLEEERWRPTGVPTIFKMVEALDRGRHQLVLAFVCKDGTSHWPKAHDCWLRLKGLQCSITVLAGRARFPSGLPCASMLLELVHAWRLWRMVRKEEPDVIYLDHANVATAALLAQFTHIPVVFRVMGIYPVMRQVLVSAGVKSRFLRWCYSRSYALVICTQDGSGVELWLDEALARDVPRVAVLNGVERFSGGPKALPALSTISARRTLVLFIGKLEPEKGALRFAEGFLKAWRKEKDWLHAVMIGTGSEINNIRNIFTEAGAIGSLTIIDRLSHVEIGAAISRADIYVSLNKFGNLSNANLEVMLSGTAMIFPAAQPDVGVDVLTSNLVSENAALRIASCDDIEGLSAAILALHRNPKERERLARQVREQAEEFSSSWDERIEWEIGLLEKIALRKRMTANELQRSKGARS